MIFKSGVIRSTKGDAQVEVSDIQVVTAFDEEAYYNQPVRVCWTENGTVHEQVADHGAHFMLSWIEIELDANRTLLVD